MDKQGVDERFYELADKWAKGTISEQEKQEYAAWYNKIDENYQLEVPYNHAHSKAEHRDLLFNKIGKELQLEDEQRPDVHKRFLSRLSVAAAVLLFLGAGAFWLLRQNHQVDKNQITGSGAVELSNIGNQAHIGAILTRADGRQVDLDTLSEGGKMLEGDARLIKQNNTLSYVASGERSAYRKEVAYNTMSTARGKEFNLVLPDGTKVWLNAASSITYPTSFTGGDRIVQLKGEAYFEVFKDKTHPFKVQTKEATIKVLGTHFDVMAYQDESVTKTTLLEGSVEVSKAGQAVKIKPGQEATVHPGVSPVAVANVPADQAIAWVKGKLSLNDLDVSALMRQVSRWYDVDFRFEGPVPEVRFWGVLNRNASLDDVLDVMKENGVAVRKEGNIVIVSSK